MRPLVIGAIIVAATRGVLMADPKFDKLAADIDDASTAVEELQVDRDDADEKLNDLRKTLEHASDVIDEIGSNDDEKA